MQKTEIPYERPRAPGSPGSMKKKATVPIKAAQSFSYSLWLPKYGSISVYYPAEASVGHAFLNARYYDGGRGQFLSQDPVFWEVGQTSDGQAALRDPQLQNSYSYAANNPIVKKDPEGRFSVSNFVEIINFLSSVNDIFNAAGSFEEFRGVNTNGFNPSGSISPTRDFVVSGASLLAPPQISVPLFLGEGFMYLGEVSGANTPEARERFNERVRNAQLQSRNYIQSYTGGYQGSSSFSGFANTLTNFFSGGGTPPANVGNAGGGGFVGTYNFGDAGTYDYGSNQWVSGPNAGSSSNQNTNN